MQVPLRDGGILETDVVGQGAPVIFIHGFPISRHMWLAAAHALPQGWKAIVPDLRGHGSSSVHPSLSIASFADDLADLHAALAPGQPAVLVGLSMGGIIAMEFWRRYPHIVRALALCNTRSNAESPEGIARRMQVARTAVEQGSLAVVDAMLPVIFGPDFPHQDRERWRLLMAQTSPVTVAAASMALAGRKDSAPTLSTITVPTLVVAGEHDAITPPSTLEAIHRAIPASTLKVIAGAGHVPPVEKPREFSAALNEFLRTLAS